MAHYEDLSCTRRPWSDFVREVGIGGGSLASTQRATNSYMKLRGDFYPRRDVLHWASKKYQILVKKSN
jgi:hypothetical protein